MEITCFIKDSVVKNTFFNTVYTICIIENRRSAQEVALNFACWLMFGSEKINKPFLPFPPSAIVPQLSLIK